MTYRKRGWIQLCVGMVIGIITHIGYIDVGEGCWRPNALVTSFNITINITITLTSDNSSEQSWITQLHKLGRKNHSEGAFQNCTNVLVFLVDFELISTDQNLFLSKWFITYDRPILTWYDCKFNQFLILVVLSFRHFERPKNLFDQGVVFGFGLIWGHKSDPYQSYRLCYFHFILFF